MTRRAKHITFFATAALIVATAMPACQPKHAPACQQNPACQPAPARQQNRTHPQKAKYAPTWESLSQRGDAPEWFRDAKLGMWAHWGPQCQPEDGDWYARLMYEDGSKQAQDHRKNYGDPSEFGFKDIIPLWTADNWNPDDIVGKFKKAGARYFVGMANHHDNFDLWNSSHQPWNSVNMGPHKNIIKGWAKAARKQGLPFGVSVHASHAWNFYEPAQAYDGRLTREDGRGKWWEGYDPQDLYQQRHPVSEQFCWEWQDTVSRPDAAYRRNFYDRTLELLVTYKPDLVYFDDTVLPFWPIGDEGLKLTAQLYNRNPKAVVTGKLLQEEHKSAIVHDVERGVLDGIQPRPWQTCTCLGNWHYDRDLYDRDGYKSAETVARILADVISKNGNLLLSVPIRADGTIDEKEEAILNDLGRWMKTNGEAVYGTRPWTVYGEGESIRFTCKGETLYAFILERPANGTLQITNITEDVAGVELLGSREAPLFEHTEKGLKIALPEEFPTQFIPVLRIIKKR